MKKLLVLALALGISQIVVAVRVANELSGGSIWVSCEKCGKSYQEIPAGYEIDFRSTGKDVSIMYPNGANAVIGCTSDKLAVRKTNIQGKSYYYVYCY